MDMILKSLKQSVKESNMQEYTVQGLANLCRENKIAIQYWSCGYVLLTILEEKHNATLYNPLNWDLLENELMGY